MSALNTLRELVKGSNSVDLIYRAHRLYDASNVTDVTSAVVGAPLEPIFASIGRKMFTLLDEKDDSNEIMIKAIVEVKSLESEVKSLKSEVNSLKSEVRRTKLESVMKDVCIPVMDEGLLLWSKAVCAECDRLLTDKEKINGAGRSLTVYVRVVNNTESNSTLYFENKEGVKSILVGFAKTQGLSGDNCLIELEDLCVAVGKEKQDRTERVHKSTAKYLKDESSLGSIAKNIEEMCELSLRQREATSDIAERLTVETSLIPLYKKSKLFCRINKSPALDSLRSFLNHERFAWIDEMDTAV